MVDRHFSTMLSGTRHQGEILVVGLGRFGSSVARTLVDMGQEVLGVDLDPDLVQEHADLLTHVVQVDSTNERAMRQIGAADVMTAVVCIGTDVESSVLSTGVLVDFGVPSIWAKALTGAHGKILQRVGAHHVVFPEADMGARVAHLLTGQMLEYVELDDDFVLVETLAPKPFVGVPLADGGLRARFNVTVVCIKQPGQPFTYATRDTILGEGDLVVVAGHRADVTRFTEST